MKNFLPLSLCVFFLSFSFYLRASADSLQQREQAQRVAVYRGTFGRARYQAMISADQVYQERRRFRKRIERLLVDHHSTGLCPELVKIGGMDKDRVYNLLSLKMEWELLCPKCNACLDSLLVAIMPDHSN